jgi:hypothetical protein
MDTQFEVIIRLTKVIDNTKDIPEQFYNVLAKKVQNVTLVFLIESLFVISI